MSEFLKEVSGFIWGMPLIALFLFAHIFTTIRTGFIQRKIFRAIKMSISPETKGHGEISPFSALATALAATIGTGNIAGVATAITLGGPGAIFWMWVIGIFAIATKYSESLLAVHYRVRRADGNFAGGAMYVIERGMGKKWKWLAVMFAVFTSLSAFGIGNMVQANTIADLLRVNYEVPNWFSGIALSIMTAFAVLGGIRGIAKTCAVVMPVIVVFYIMLCVALLLIYWQNVPQAIYTIVESAFTGQSAAGGFLGATTAQAIRYGAARGLFSNESGMGSAPIVAAAAKTRNAVRQGLISATGTFWDTVVMCALMGIVLVSSGAWKAVSPDGEVIRGVMITREAFGALGAWGKDALAAITLGVVLSTILGWSYYGEKAIEYLFGERGVPYYRILWVIAVYVGATNALDDVFNFSDITNGLMSVPNLIALFCLSGLTSKATKKYFSRGGGRRENSDRRTAEAKIKTMS